jgi:hypothetical protein
MKKQRLAVFVGIAAVLIGSLAVAGCSSGQAATVTSAGTPGVTQSTAPGPTQSSIPSSTQNSTSGSAQSSTTGSDQVLPVANNPIVNTSTKQGLEIVSAMVENNVDPATGKDIADRLQITLKNTSSETLSDLEVYYEMKDVTTQKTEGYYQKLTGFNLAPGTEGTVFFDNQAAAGHYPENKFSLYRTSANEVDFSIEVSAAGYAPAMGQAVKAVGTGENPGE